MSTNNVEVPQVIEVDCSTGESITRDMTAEEITAQEARLVESQAAQAALEAEAAAKAEAKAAGIAVLKAQGLTDEQISALFG